MGISSAARGLGLAREWIEGVGDEDVDMRESHGLGTRGLSDSDSPNILGVQVCVSSSVDRVYAAAWFVRSVRIRGIIVVCW